MTPRPDWGNKFDSSGIYRCCGETQIKQSARAFKIHKIRWIRHAVHLPLSGCFVDRNFEPFPQGDVRVKRPKQSTLTDGLRELAGVLSTHSRLPEAPDPHPGNGDALCAPSHPFWYTDGGDVDGSIVGVKHTPTSRT